jgi:hypothetical protein
MRVEVLHSEHQRVAEVLIEDAGGDVILTVGDLWRSNDPRDHGRVVRILHLYQNRAQVINIVSGRRSMIAFERFLADKRRAYTKLMN